MHYRRRLRTRGGACSGWIVPLKPGMTPTALRTETVLVRSKGTSVHRFLTYVLEKELLPMCRNATFRGSTTERCSVFVRNSIPSREQGSTATDIRHPHGFVAKCADCSRRLDGRRGRIPCHELQRPGVSRRRIVTADLGSGHHVRWVLLSSPETSPGTQQSASPDVERERSEAPEPYLTCVKYEKYMTKPTFREFALLAFPT